MHYIQPPHRVFPFRWIFPVGQLFLCMLLVSIALLPPRYVPHTFADHIDEAIATMNLPGVLIELPTVIFSANHVLWRPPFLTFRMWRAISWPVLGMVFWWIAGRATEALLAINYRQLAPKIGWVETVTGFLVMAAGATMFGGMLFGLSAAQRDMESTRLAAAGGLWALLGSLSVIARFRQWRLHKKQKASAN
jgi:hypothetical protein